MKKSLGENTSVFIETTFGKKKQNEMGEQGFKASKFNMRKLFIAACAVLAVGGLIFYNMPVNYLSLEINSSVELGLNAFNKVVSS